MEGIEDEIEERLGLENGSDNEQDKARTSLFEEVDNAQKNTQIDKQKDDNIDFSDMQAMFDASMREEGEAELEEGEMLAHDQDHIENGGLFKAKRNQ